MDDHRSNDRSGQSHRRNGSGTGYNSSRHGSLLNASAVNGTLEGHERREQPRRANHADRPRAEAALDYAQQR